MTLGNRKKTRRSVLGALRSSMDRQSEANNDSEMSWDELEEHHAVMHDSVSEFWKLNEPTRTFDTEPTSMGGRPS